MEKDKFVVGFRLFYLPKGNAYDHLSHNLAQTHLEVPFKLFENCYNIMYEPPLTVLSREKSTKKA